MSYSIDDLAEHAKKLGLKTIVLAGYDAEGQFHFASTNGDMKEIGPLLLLANKYAFDGPTISPERRHTRALPDTSGWDAETLAKYHADRTWPFK